MSNLAIDLVQLTKQFGKEEPLFSDLTLKIEKGEFVVIIGPNGSGKTTLVKIIMGLDQQTSGEAHVYESKIGYVPQHLNKDEFSPITVKELLILKMPRAGFWFNRDASEKKIKKILKRTNVSHVIDMQVRHLSGGQLQRVMIAYALIDDPGLLILDEPISGIDIHGEQDFFDLIESIHEEQPITILMISHDIDVVYRYASKVVCLNKTLVCQGVPADVLTKETIEKTFSTKHGIYHHQHKDVDKKK